MWPFKTDQTYPIVEFKYNALCDIDLSRGPWVIDLDPNDEMNSVPKPRSQSPGIERILGI